MLFSAFEFLKSNQRRVLSAMMVEKTRLKCDIIERANSRVQQDWLLCYYQREPFMLKKKKIVSFLSNYFCLKYLSSSESCPVIQMMHQNSFPARKRHPHDKENFNFFFPENKLLLVKENPGNRRIITQLLSSKIDQFIRPMNLFRGCC